jgi:uracil permease
MKNFAYGALHALVSFTAMAVVTSVLGLSMVYAFLFAGIGTLVFHLVTKNRLPSVLGVSGLYIGSILFVSQTFGLPFVFGGIITAGLVYIIFGLIMLKWQDKIMNLFPDWLLSIVILLIALSLIPIGVGLAGTNLLIAVVAIATTALVDISGIQKLRPFSMPLGILIATLVAFFTTGIDISFAFTPIEFSWVAPQFNWQAMLTIGGVALAVLFEMMGDIKNTGSIIGKNVFKEVGVGRISIGNGLATLIGGFGNSNCYTTYSENNAFLIQTRYYNPKAQIWTALIFILLAFLTPVHSLILSIPTEAFGGVLVYLFSLIGINAIRNILNSGIDLNKDDKVFVIMSTMLAVSVLSFMIAGVAVSSVAISAIVGIVLHLIFNRRSDNDGTEN